MRVPLEWLYEHCDPGLGVAAVAERLTMTGTKVEATHHHGVGAVEHFVVGRVLEAGRHPDADRLSVCRVDVGGDEVAGIVCGAPNVAAGQTVAVARPGAVMPDGRRLEAAKLRGVVSEGMILAEDEMAIGVEHDGILVLDDLVVDAEFAPGTPLADVLPIATEVLELEITPNRPDCLAVYGVARELHAATGAALSEPPWADDPGGDGELAAVEVAVLCPELCPRFTARLFEDVTVAPSPPWLKARLMAAGQRPINNVVDITNYAMLLTGQPMHAFDADRIAGGRLVVRTARDGETIETLDGQRRTLDEQMVVIEDAQGPTSIAGVMGGARSEVALQSTSVLMEAATWNGPNIHRTSWALGLRSEASGRFEKGLAPEQALFAQAVASRLMTRALRRPPRARDRRRRWSGAASGGYPPARAAGGGHPRGADRARAPVRDPRGAGIRRPAGWRRTGRQRAAAAARRCHPRGRPHRGGRPDRRDRQAARHAAQAPRRLRSPDSRAAPAPPRRRRARGPGPERGRGLDLHRARAPGPPAPGARRRAAPRGERSRTRCRPTSRCCGPRCSARCWTSPTTTSRAGQATSRLFEVGTVFAAGAEPRPHEHCSLGVLLRGRVSPPTWRSPDPPSRRISSPPRACSRRWPPRCGWRSRSCPRPSPSCTRRAPRAICAGDAALGWVGELHPLIAADWDLDAASSSDGARVGLAVAELDLDRLIAAAPASQRYEDLLSFPAVRQDLAVIVPDDVPAAAVLATVRAAAGDLLDDVHVFDVYTGPQVGEGRRSLALALSLRARDRTLTDDDVLPVRSEIVARPRARAGG